MPGVSLEIKAQDKDLTELLQKLQKKTGDLSPAMRVIGEIVRTSVLRNFEAGGRPTRWKPVKLAFGKKKGGTVLRRRGMGGGLMGSINARAQSHSVTIGTNKVYAAVHQFGAKRGEFGKQPVSVRPFRRKDGAKVKGHTRNTPFPWGDIPARPFLMVQNEDWTEINEAVGDFLMGS